MKLTSYLIFNGQAEEAANLYANILGGKIGELHRYDSMPADAGMPEIPNDFKQKIMHCCIAVLMHNRFNAPLAKFSMPNAMAKLSIALVYFGH